MEERLAYFTSRMEERLADLPLEWRRVWVAECLSSPPSSGSPGWSSPWMFVLPSVCPLACTGEHKPHRQLSLQVGLCYSGGKVRKQNTNYCQAISQLLFSVWKVSSILMPMWPWKKDIFFSLKSSILTPMWPWKRSWSHELLWTDKALCQLPSCNVWHI